MKSQRFSGSAFNKGGKKRDHSVKCNTNELFYQMSVIAYRTSVPNVNMQKSDVPLELLRVSATSHRLTTMF